MNKSINLNVSIASAPGRVYEFVLNAKNLPLWATAFCQSATLERGLWIVETPEGPAALRFAERNELGVLDHYVSPESGVETYVPMRVIPNDEGSEVQITLFQQPGMSDEAFLQDANRVRRDLQSLKSVLETAPEAAKARATVPAKAHFIPAVNGYESDATPLEPLPDVPEELLRLAGYVLGHYAWRASKLSKDDQLFPLAVLEKSGQRQILRFDAPNLDQGLKECRQTLAHHQSGIDSWSFGYLCQAEKSGKMVDVFNIEAWRRGMTSPAVFVQRYQPFSTGVFKVWGAPSMVVEGRRLKPVQCQQLMQILYAGVQDHPSAGPMWAEWHAY